jgi:hypothetical protein
MKVPFRTAITCLLSLWPVRPTESCWWHFWTKGSSSDLPEVAKGCIFMAEAKLIAVSRLNSKRHKAQLEGAIRTAYASFCWFVAWLSFRPEDGGDIVIRKNYKTTWHHIPEESNAAVTSSDLTISCHS